MMMLLPFTLKREVEVGDLLTAASVFLAFVGLLIALLNDRQARRREYADRIRRSAALIVAAMERWSAINLQLYHDIRPLLERSDTHLVRFKDETKTRNFLWQGLVEAHAEALHRVFAEKVEVEYAGLNGYDARVEALFKAAAGALQRAERVAFDTLLLRAQDLLLEEASQFLPFETGWLGDQLMIISRDVERRLRDESQTAITAFGTAMQKLLCASDSEIAWKRVRLPGAVPAAA